MARNLTETRELQVGDSDTLCFRDPQLRVKLNPNVRVDAHLADEIIGYQDFVIGIGLADYLGAVESCSIIPVDVHSKLVVRKHAPIHENIPAGVGK